MDPNHPSADPEGSAPGNLPESRATEQEAGASETGQAQVPTRQMVHRLQSRYETLETLFALTVSGLIVMSLGFNLFLFKQTRLARAQVQQYRPTVSRAVTDFHQNREPKIRNFIGSLQEFAHRDPELQRILETYRQDLGKYLDPPAAFAPPSLAPAGTNVTR